MSTDTLDSLSNATLNERFAQAYGGWTFRAPTGALNKIQKRGYLAHKDGRCCTLWKGEASYGGDPIPDYCGSVDAVLPWMDKGSAECHRLYWAGRSRRWQVEVWPDRGYRGCGVADTLARSAVIALLRADAAAEGGQTS